VQVLFVSPGPGGPSASLARLSHCASILLSAMNRIDSVVSAEAMGPGESPDTKVQSFQALVGRTGNNLTSVIRISGPQSFLVQFHLGLYSMHILQFPMNGSNSSWPGE
jgi:hypothetical protein